jgi:hypothetical protein
LSPTQASIGLSDLKYRRNFDAKSAVDLEHLLEEIAISYDKREKEEHDRTSVYR